MSDRRVTGTALNKILTASKQYIDNHDLGFEEVMIDDTGEIFYIPQISFCQHGDIYAEDVMEILNKSLYNLPDDDNTTK